MLNMLGATRIYTVPEVNALLRRRTGFRIVDKLPDIRLASQDIIYFKTTGEKTEDADGNTYPVVIPYIVGVDPDWLADEGETCGCTNCTPDCCPPELGDPKDHLVWYTTGSTGSGDYEQLQNLPSINGETFLGDMDEDKARADVSENGTSGGYDLSIHDDEIADCVREVYE